MWVKTSTNHIPTKALKAGEDVDGSPLYVGRAKHECGFLIPGKVQPNYGFCYIAYDGEEFGKEEYEVLTNHKLFQMLKWKE